MPDPEVIIPQINADTYSLSARDRIRRMDSPTTEPLYKWLTIAIAASAFFQAVFAGFLFWLQYEFRIESRRTMVAVALEVLTSSTSTPRAEVRFENASRSGVLLTRLTLVARAKGRHADPLDIDYRFSIPEYGSRVKDITNIVFQAARSVDPAEPAWTQGAGQGLTVFFELTPHYAATGKRRRHSKSVTYRVEFFNANLASATIVNDED